MRTEPIAPVRTEPIAPVRTEPNGLRGPNPTRGKIVTCWATALRGGPGTNARTCLRGVLVSAALSRVLFRADGAALRGGPGTNARTCSRCVLVSEALSRGLFPR